MTEIKEKVELSTPIKVEITLKELKVIQLFLNEQERISQTFRNKLEENDTDIIDAIALKREIEEILKSYGF